MDRWKRQLSGAVVGKNYTSRKIRQTVHIKLRDIRDPWYIIHLRNGAWERDAKFSARASILPARTSRSYVSQTVGRWIVVFRLKVIKTYAACHHGAATRHYMYDHDNMLVWKATTWHQALSCLWWQRLLPGHTIIPNGPDPTSVARAPCRCPIALGKNNVLYKARARYPGEECRHYARVSSNGLGLHAMAMDEFRPIKGRVWKTLSMAISVSTNS